MSKDGLSTNSSPSSSPDAAHGYDASRLNLPFVGLCSFGKYPYHADWENIPCINAFSDQAPFHLVQVDAHLDFVDERHGVTPSHGGYLYYEILELMDELTKQGDIIGMDLVEVAPDYDPAGSTQTLAAQILPNTIGRMLYHCNT